MLNSCGVARCRLVQLPKVTDPRGSLSFVESGNHIPFEIKRIYYLYDIAAGATRGEHGHRKLEQLFVAMCGSFDVTLDDGHITKRFHLSHPWEGLYVSPMMWRSIHNFSPGATCLVLASAPYDESDYYRDYGVFLQAVRGGV